MFALHVGLAVGGLGQRQRLAEHRLVLDVPHQAAAGVRHGALVHQLHVQNKRNLKSRVQMAQQKHRSGDLQQQLTVHNCLYIRPGRVRAKAKL